MARDPVCGMYVDEETTAFKTVVDGKTGILFGEPTAENLLAAIKRFEKLKINAKDCITQAQKFNKERFKKELKSFVDKYTRVP